MPDGCRDLIVKSRGGAAPVCFVTDVAACCDRVDVQVGDGYDGFRMQPGARIDRIALLASLEDGLATDEIIERIHSYVTIRFNVSEALARLSQGKHTVAKAAADLGVDPRSLQRLLQRETGWAPVFWLRLARVRRAAVRVMQAETLAELAYDMGYADQSHMTREFRHWLGITPRQIQRDADWGSQHLGPGYGA